MFFKRKARIAQEHASDRAADLEVKKITAKAHRVADKTTDSSEALSDLLKSNGITFMIHTAAGGKHGH